MRVAIVGAGPAGAAAAIELARAGAAVTLYEKSAWPRAKTCGDGLTPSSVLELTALGIPLDDAPKLDQTLISGPGETTVRAGWPDGMPPGRTLERRGFDARLVDAALAAGAEFRERTPVRDIGALAADAVLLAEGATGGLARARGFPAYRSRLIAVRGYVDAARDVPLEYAVHYARALTPGYAWVFPIGRRRVNVGLAVDPRVAARAGNDVRALLRRWLQASRFARAALAGGAPIAEVTGGVIPSGRARRYADGVFLVGDAAGVADPLSAEGVSQALASGRDAARALIAAGGDVRAAGPAYEERLARFDRNEREARRMRALFGHSGDALIRLAASRPALASYLVETGYFLKSDARWFFETLARTVLTRRGQRGLRGQPGSDLPTTTER
jgi:geranylgeranyl reductase family protein